MRVSLVVFTMCLFLSAIGNAQERGSVIPEFGKTFIVESPEYETDTTAVYKVVFDVGRSFDDATKPNPLIETAARFINMHVQAGVPYQNIKVALVFHGSAANDILKNEIYAKRKALTEDYNPNSLLLKALAIEDVQLILCGQTAASRKIMKEDTHPDVKFALSAMTALVQLQNKGYRLINF